MKTVRVLACLLLCLIAAVSLIACEQNDVNKYEREINNNASESVDDVFPVEGETGDNSETGENGNSENGGTVNPENSGTDNSESGGTDKPPQNNSSGSSDLGDGWSDYY